MKGKEEWEVASRLRNGCARGYYLGKQIRRDAFYDCDQILTRGARMPARSIEGSGEARDLRVEATVHLTGPYCHESICTTQREGVLIG